MKNKLNKLVDKLANQVQHEYEQTKQPVENIKGVEELTLDKSKGKAKQTVRKGVDEIQTKKQKKEENIRNYRREASRLASIANKRVERLEKNKFFDSPAYRGYIASGGGKFGIKGKDFNEVQREVARMRAFLDANTSTVRGLNSYLKGMAEATGMKYSNMQDLYKKAGKFFELSNKVEEYLRQVEDIASAIGYQKIWEAVNQYVADHKVDLASANLDIDQMILKISDGIAEYNNPERIFLKEGFLDTDNGTTKSSWFKLKKD